MNHASLLVLLLAVTTVAGCGGRAEVERRIDPDADDLDGTVEQTTTLRGESLQEEAARLMRQHDYDGAIAIYRDLYRHDSRDEVRAEALYSWARAEGHLLNPERDVDEAIARLEMLLEEFDHTRIAFRAREELERLQRWKSSVAPR
ncbi:MAG TPA: hypothetical protein VKA86_10780 [Candidatus Krumholzibacteria bacterium]|nr:hypothetical protein [Candidatus Krumholzibacteria bacterium]